MKERILSIVMTVGGGLFASFSNAKFTFEWIVLFGIGLVVVIAILQLLIGLYLIVEEAIETFKGEK